MPTARPFYQSAAKRQGREISIFSDRPNGEDHPLFSEMKTKVLPGSVPWPF